MYKIYHVRESNLTLPKDEFTALEVIKLSDVQTLEQRVKALEAENARLRETIRQTLNELGVPLSIGKAVKLLRQALAPRPEGA